MDTVLQLPKNVGVLGGRKEVVYGSLFLQTVEDKLFLQSTN